MEEKVQLMELLQCHYITDLNNFKLETAIAWIRCMQMGRSPIDKLRENGIEEIIVYGITELGKLLVDEARIKRYRILGITDRKITGGDYLYQDIPILNRKQLDMYKERCIVITAMAFWYDINAELRTLGYKNIVALRELL